MPLEDRPEFRPEPLPAARRGTGAAWLAALVIAAAAGWWWLRPATPPLPTPVASAPTPAAETPAPAALPDVPRYPVDAPDQGPLAEGDLPSALAALLGSEAATRFLLTDDLARRLVATIDNLGRDHAPPALWPVRPTSGRFGVAEGATGSQLDEANAGRYAPFVRMVVAVDAAAAAGWYRRAYPQLQQAWRALGLGDRHLNDRVVEVVDSLLAAPQPAEPPRLQLTQVKGPMPSARPWVHYRFVDPALEALPAGQKIMVRVGPAHQRALRAKLTQLRAELVKPAARS